MEHFSHEHPLLLSDHQEQQKDDGGEEIYCDGCFLPLSSSGGGDPTYYNCIECKYFLHKSCAELPHKIIHFLHPRHPLTLLVSSLCHASAQYDRCEECDKQILGFKYQCSFCSFHLDIKCASLLDTVQAEGHEHTFMLLRPMRWGDGSRVLHICDACGTAIEGMSYLCTTCQFKAHECCITITRTIKLICHSHQLHLYYFAPEYQHCNICVSEIFESFLFYSCSICTYTVHLSCALSEDLRDAAFLLKGENKEPIPLDPIPNNHNETNNIIDSTITQDFSIINLEENQLATAELKHFSHPHLLVLGENDLECDKKYCEGCSWPIFDLPFYNCSPCNFHLHKDCAQLPREISHLLHHHPLTLSFNEPNEVNIHGTFDCYGCKTKSNGFAYSCDLCNFSIDVRCGFLTATLEHKYHPEHTLIFVQDTRFKFRCKNYCSATIDFRYATLPYTTKHRCPKHNWEFYPFPLNFGTEKGTAKETFYCDLCEEERDTSHWFYYCEDCDYSAHPSCVLSNSPNKSKRL